MESFWMKTEFCKYRRNTLLPTFHSIFIFFQKIGEINIEIRTEANCIFPIRFHHHMRRARDRSSGLPAGGVQRLPACHADVRTTRFLASPFAPAGRIHPAGARGRFRRREVRLAIGTTAGLPVYALLPSTKFQGSTCTYQPVVY